MLQDMFWRLRINFAMRVTFVMNHSFEFQERDVSDYIQKAVIEQIDMEAAMSQQLRGIITSR